MLRDLIFPSNISNFDESNKKHQREIGLFMYFYLSNNPNVPPTQSLS